MLVEKIPENELNMMTSYVDSYAIDGGLSATYNADSRRKDITEVLSVWEEAKNKYLYNLLGNKMILKKEIDFAKPVATLKAEFTTEPASSPINIFKSRMQDLFWSAPELKRYSSALSCLFHPDFLVSGKYELSLFMSTFELNLKGEDKPFRISNGMKITKILNKIATAYGIEGYEEFRIRHSQILNKKSAHGTLCLSIHPLDYMTMSDNASRWDSCMSWENIGAYRSGTVEMMNSENTLVAYLEGSEPMRMPGPDEDATWNNKKWRELFVVTPEIMTEIKGYPYQSEEIAEIVLAWIKELAHKNLGWEYGNTIAHNGKKERISTTKAIAVPENADSDYVCFNFNTLNMYNDFGTKDRHLAKVGNCAFRPGTRSSYIKDLFFDITYSGKCQCVWCGEDMYYDAENDTSRLVCNSCGEGSYCYCCGEHISLEDAIYVDGEYYCEYCFDENCCTDIHDEYHRRDNCYEIYIAAEADEPYRFEDMTIYIEEYEYNHTNTLNELLVEGAEVKQHKTNYITINYINGCDMTEKLARIVGYKSIDSLINTGYFTKFAPDLELVKDDEE